MAIFKAPNDPLSAILSSISGNDLMPSFLRTPVQQRSWVRFPFKPGFFQVSSFQPLRLKHFHCDDLHIILSLSAVQIYEFHILMLNFTAYCSLGMFQVISRWITSGVSLLILAAISIDRLLALTLHLRYNIIVTVPRVFQTALILWMFSIIFVMSRFWMSSTDWLFLPVV